MRFGFETLGNATIAFREEGRPVLATDPWLTGTCYFGSWGLDRELTDEELTLVRGCQYIWVSNGRPEHFHRPSLDLLRAGQNILIPDHYNPDIKRYLEQRGFAVEVLPYRGWKRLSPGIRVLCLDNENQDAILLIEAGDSLVVNLNDSPLCGERRFIRDIVGKYDTTRTYLAARYADDASLFNLVDSEGRSAIDPPDRRKPAIVSALAEIAESLHVGSYVSSASQHVCLRRDAVWANPYLIGWLDVARYWTRPAIRTIEPYVKVNLDTGEYTRKQLEQTSAIGQPADMTDDDDWTVPLIEDEWAALSEFFTSIDILRPYVDYLEFRVAGETRRIWINLATRGEKEAALRGIAFHAPARSLMSAVRAGNFTTVMNGNFMTAELRGVSLYQNFAPIMAILAGAAGVRTFAAWRRFRRRYFRRNPIGYLEWHCLARLAGMSDVARRWADRLHIKRPLQVVYRKHLGDPVR